MNQPVLQIGILSHNKEQYIEKCIQSVIEQKCNFKFEIHILDDCSSDRSAKIIQEYADKYPDIITFRKNIVNKGVKTSTRILLNYATAKYLCFIDGDDYWCNSEKLQAQIDFLEANHDYAGCFHDSEIVSSVMQTWDNVSNRSQNIFKTYSQFNHYKSDLYPGNIIKRTIIPTASLVFRRVELDSILESQTDYLSLYWIMQLEIIKNSKFKYFNKIWSVYRDHPQGFSKTHDLLRFKMQHINVLTRLLDDNYYKYFKADIYESIASEYRNLIWSIEYEKNNSENLKDFITAFKKYSNLALKYQLKDFSKIFH